MIECYKRKVAKPGNTVKEGDIIEIRFGGGEIES